MSDKNEDLFILKPGDKNLKEVFANCIGAIQAVMQQRPIEVIIRPFKFKRSNIANAYLHGWVFRNQIMKKLNDAGIAVKVPDINEATGERTEKDVEWTVESLKVFFKGDFIIEQIVEIPRFIIDGIEYREEVHPSQFNGPDFWKYCDLIAYYASVLWDIEVEPPTHGKWYTYYEQLQQGR